MKIEISSDFTPFPTLPERFVTMRGSVNGLTDALNMVMEQLPRQFERNDRDSYCEQIIIKYENAGRLIGKGGQTIKSISEETGTMVFFSLCI